MGESLLGELYMRRSYRLVIALLVGVLVAAVSGLVPTGAAGAVGNGSISGTVTVEAGASRDDVMITLYEWTDGYWQDLDYAQPDANGTYTFTGVGAADYVIGYTGTGLVSEFWNDAATPDDATSISVGIDQRVAAIDAFLDTGGRISGTVTGLGGVPLAGVDVTAYQWNGVDESWQAMSGGYTFDDGTYDMAGLRPGTYRIGFLPSGDTGYAQEYWNNAPTVAMADPITVTDGGNASARDAALGPAAHITGTVTAAGRVLLEGVEVTAYAQNGTSGDWVSVTQTYTLTDGTYDLGGLPSGTYRIQFRDYFNGHLSEFWNDKPTILAADDITVTAGNSAVGRNATLVEGAHITGTVTGEGDEPLADIEVTAYEWNATDKWWEDVAYAYTDPNGMYDLAGLPTGTYRLGFSDYIGASHAQEYWDDSASLEGAADIAVVAPATVAAHDAQLAVAGGISGTVTVPTGSDLTHVWVAAYESVGGQWEYVRGAYVERDGTYTVGALPAGTYRVGFEDDAAHLASEYWNDKTTIEAADDIVVSSGATNAGRNASLVAAASALTYKNSVLPSISGIAQVGQSMTASPGTWTPTGATYAYQWLAEGSDISGATGPSLTLADRLVGQRITVRVTASGGAPSAGSATSIPTAAVTAAPATTPPPTVPTAPSVPTGPTAPSAPTPTITNRTAPKIGGTLRVGKVLKLSKGSWAPSTVTLKYQWLASGKKIKKATRATLTLTRAQRGKRIQVRVTAILAGARDVVITTRPTAKVKA